MCDKKIIANSLIISILLFNTPIDAIANTINNYKIVSVNSEKNYLKESNVLEEFLSNLFDKFKRQKEIIKVNKNVVIGKIKEVTLNDGEFVPNLDGNTQGYETIKVITIGDKKLVKEDYDNLRTSGIPKVDLSNSKSDSIPQGAFKDSTHLTEFKFPKGITSIGDTSSYEGAFKNCVNLTGELIIPDTVTKIGHMAFSGCTGFTGDLIIPDSVKNMGEHVFSGCNGFNGVLKIGKSVNNIGFSSFKDCTGLIGDLIIPDSVNYIGEYAFEGCTGFNGKLIIGKSVSIISSYAFSNCSGLNGEIIIPKSTTDIGSFVFSGCDGFTGDLIIPNSVSWFKNNPFDGLNNIDRIIIKVNEYDKETNYKEGLIKKLPDTEKTVIDLPYNFNTSGTWMESTNKTIAKPIIKNIVGDEELEADGNVGETISLYIPVPYDEKNINILKDNKPYKLPNKNDENKYIFTNSGYYNVTITTTLGNTSNILFEVENIQYKEAESALEKSESSKSPKDIQIARDLVNSLPESLKKDELQNRLNLISPNIEFEIKGTSANLDIYIKSKSMLSLSLNTNNVTFEDFSGIQNEEKLNAITLTVNSSLPYEVKAYLKNEIIGSHFKEILDKRIFNIRVSGKEYKTFNDTVTPIILLDNEAKGNNKIHNIDLMLKGELAHKKDIYKATIEFEVEQK